MATKVTSADIKDATIVAADIASSLKPSGSAASTDESLRRLGTGSTHAAAGDDSRFPTTGEKNALAGTSGTPGSGNKYVTDQDSRLTDSRAPSGSAGGALDGSYPNPGLAASVAGAGLAESADVLSVNVDGSTIEINADALRVKDGGITAAKLSFDPATQAELDAHTGDTSAAHAASAISADSTTLVGTGTDVQAVLEELDNGIADHLADTSAAHAASAISNSAAGNIAATDVQAAINELDSEKVPTARTISNGFGITGGGDLSANRTLAVALSTAEAFLTTAQAISAAAYADLTGCSVSLAAGTWLILAELHASAANTAFLAHLAITDGSNNIVREGSQGMPASGSANIHQWGSVGLSVIVTPGGTTTYKLRAARGNTTITGTYTAQDGSGVAVTNNASDNTDKGTSIRAIRIA